jgi:hypothetical protein
MVRPQFTSEKTGGVKKNSIGFADQVFMVGGRAGEHTGVFIEFAAGDVATGQTADLSTGVVSDGAGPYANVQMFNSFDMGDMKVGATVWADGFGEDSGLQLMSVWGQHGGLLGGKALTINGAMAGDAGGVGVTGWAGNETWNAQLAMVDIAGIGGFTLAPVLRGNYFLDAGDWEVGLGAIAVTGSQKGTDTKRTGIDVQAMGEVGDMQIGVFADYATAPSSSSTTANVYNASTTDTRTGYSLRASVKPTHNIIVLAGVGQDKTGATKTDKTLVGVEWEAYQNFAVSLSYDENKTTASPTVKTTLLDFELLI